ncbi:hypothetical protein PCANB_001374 [Pneumocystis canis]|nr:hypothetical protein PCANB_001374 [Pneumocystis canis]
MPLNILKHKSWNVYNKNNIEKVLRDEALAKKKEEEEEMRMSIADGERRLKILRERSGLKEFNEIDDREAGDVYMSNEFLKNKEKRKKDDIEISDDEFRKRNKPFSNNKHINFWEDFESGKVSVDYRNPEYEKEKADADRKWNDMITVRLKILPWYSHSSLQSTQKRNDKEFLERNMKIQNSIKDFNDPLTTMQAYLRQKKKIKESELNKKEYSLLNFSLDSGEKSENLRKRKNSKDMNEDIKALREARLFREYEERRRLQLLGDASKQYTSDYKVVGKYSSQYNPEYVNKHR